MLNSMKLLLICISSAVGMEIAGTIMNNQNLSFFGLLCVFGTIISFITCLIEIHHVNTSNEQDEQYYEGE